MEPWRAKKRKAALRRSIPSVFPLPMSPGYASTWMQMAVRPATTFTPQISQRNFFLLQGNMKQHMLTHKIRDMPQHMFENKPPSISGDDSTPLPPSLPSREPASSDGEQHQQQQTSPQVLQPPQQVKSEQEPQQIKREPTETELPLPKRPPSKCQSLPQLFSSKMI